MVTGDILIQDLDDLDLLPMVLYSLLEADLSHALFNYWLSLSNEIPS